MIVELQGCEDDPVDLYSDCTVSGGSATPFALTVVLIHLLVRYQLQWLWYEY